MMEQTVVIQEGDGNSPIVLAPELQHIFNLRVNPQNGYIYMGEIEEDTDEDLAMALDYFAHSGIQEVTIRLNSPGGDVKSMFAIHDLIRTSPRDICVVGYGEICSAAVLILACAHRRVVMENCCLMSHEPKVTGDEDGLGLRAAKDRRQWEDWILTQWCELMARYTGKEAKWWKDLTEKKKAEYWLLGGKAIVEAGLADEVIHE